MFWLTISLILAVVELLLSIQEWQEERRREREMFADVDGAEAQKGSGRLGRGCRWTVSDVLPWMEEDVSK